MKPKTMNALFFLFSAFLSLACVDEVQKLPTEKTIEQTQPELIPPLYQQLYNSPGLPTPSIELQRVRIFIWLQRMKLNADQLKRLAEIRLVVVDRQQKIIAQERKKAQQILEQEKPIYNELWDNVSQKKQLSDDFLSEAAQSLQQVRTKNNRAESILTMRIEAIRSILEAQQPFLRTLSPQQEQTLVDVLFFLRHHLDPIANPQDFRNLVGTTYEPGQYAVLTRGTSKIARQTMNIGGLWTDKNELTGKNLHEARREVLLYLALLDPGMEEALRVAQGLR